MFFRIKLNRSEPNSEPDLLGVLAAVEAVVLLEAWLDNEFVSKLLLFFVWFNDRLLIDELDEDCDIKFDVKFEFGKSKASKLLLLEASKWLRFI